MGAGAEVAAGAGATLVQDGMRARAYEGWVFSERAHARMRAATHVVGVAANDACTARSRAAQLGPDVGSKSVSTQHSQAPLNENGRGGAPVTDGTLRTCIV